MAPLGGAWLASGARAQPDFSACSCGFAAHAHSWRVPAKPAMMAEMLAKVVLLQYRDGLSDETIRGAADHSVAILRTQATVLEVELIGALLSEDTVR